MPENTLQVGTQACVVFGNDLLDDEAKILAFIHQRYPWLNETGHELRIEKEIESPIGKHMAFQHYYRNLPVYQNGVRISVDRNNRLLQAIFNLSNLVFSANNQITGYLFINNKPIEVVKKDFINEANGHSEIYLTTTGEVVYSRDLKLYASKDTVVKGYVFLPNPVQSAKVSYGSPYVNANDSDVPQLLAEQKKVSFNAQILNDTFRLAGGKLFFGEVSLPHSTPAWSLGDSFYFNRSHPFFEEINSFYHLLTYSKYLQNTGFSYLLDSIKIDAHAFNGGDNSAFDPAVYPYTLEYGTGGVEDAEDGQVVIHEFGHSLSQMASPNTVIGSERSTMEEGTADYFCVSYSRWYNSYNWDKVFTWDGHNEYWNGFMASTKKIYPNDLTNNTNNDREIWSSTLMCIYEKLGSSVTDSLVLNYLPLQGPNTNMPQMARSILKVDSLLWSGSHNRQISDCFVERGILKFGVSVNTPESTKPFKVLNSQAFASGHAKLSVLADNPFLYSIFTANGQLVMQSSAMSSVAIINPEELPSGIYYMLLEINEMKYTVKLIRI